MLFVLNTCGTGYFPSGETSWIPCHLSVFDIFACFLNYVVIEAQTNIVIVKPAIFFHRFHMQICEPSSEKDNSQIYIQM